MTHIATKLLVPACLVQCINTGITTTRGGRYLDGVKGRDSELRFVHYDCHIVLVYRGGV